jgi:hypothetical protein
MKHSATPLVLESDYSFDSLWKIQTEWFEPPNTTRGGWSGVIKTELEVNRRNLSVFIKRQDRHLTRTWRHPISGTPTFQKEYANICLLRALHIPTLEPVYFERESKKAILITKALDDYSCLDKLCKQDFSFDQIRSLLGSLANVIRTLHEHRLQHNCLYPKHIFVRQSKDGWKVRLIDLEKLRRRLYRKNAQLRDLSSLSRHADTAWSRTDRLRFFKEYVGETRLSSSSKTLWKEIARKSVKKRR